MHATTIATIGDLIHHGYRMTAWCPQCATNIEVDLHRLAEKYGRQESYIVGRTRIRIVCRRCGAKPLRYVISAR